MSQVVMSCRVFSSAGQSRTGSLAWHPHRIASHGKAVTRSVRDHQEISEKGMSRCFVTYLRRTTCTVAEGKVLQYG